MGNKWGRVSRKAQFIFIFVLVIMILSSCTKIKTPMIEVTEDEINDKPEAGGEISLGCVEPLTLNPIFNKNKTYLDISKLLFEGLFDYDSTMKLTPVLADSWSFNNGLAQCIIKIKNGISWSDGEQFNAADVKFTMDTIKYSPDSIYKKNMEQIISYQVISNDTIKINFSKYATNPLDVLTFPIIPQHIYGKNANAVPVGTGNYMVSDYSKSKKMELTVNSKKTMPKEPYLSKINIIFINDMEAFSTAFRAKELDMISTSEYDWEKYKELQDVNTAKFTTNNFEFISLNMNEDLFKENAVRKAMMLGINRRQLIDKIMLGNASLTDTPINPATWLFDGKASTFDYNKTEAKKVLEDAGFVDSNDDKIYDKQVDKTKFSLRFTLITNDDNTFRKAMCEEIKKNLEEIGFHVDLEFLPFEDVKKAMESKKYDAALTGLNISNDQDLSFMLSSIKMIGTKNYGSYSNPDLDLILSSAGQTVNENEKKQYFANIQDSIRADVPVISLFFREAAIVSSGTIKGALKPDLINPYRNIEEWYVVKTKPEQ